MSKRVVFFNYYHNGDIHVSRRLVYHIMNKVRQIDPTVQFAYGHRNSPDLLADIDGLAFDPLALSIVRNDHTGLMVLGDTIYFNTWYAQQNFKYMNRYGITIDSLYSAFDDSCKSLWGFSLDQITTDPQLFFPAINYDKFFIQEAKNWISNNQQKKIFVSNGAALSGQAHNFSLTNIVNSVAKNHSDKIFILSNRDMRTDAPNIVYSSDIIKKNGSDLNENSFLSLYCDTIIGKASGTFSFAMTQDNLFHRNTKFLAFCNLPTSSANKFWLSDKLRDKVNYRAQFIVSNEIDENTIFKIIDSAV